MNISQIPFEIHFLRILFELLGKTKNKLEQDILCFSVQLCLIFFKLGGIQNSEIYLFSQNPRPPPVQEMSEVSFPTISFKAPLRIYQVPFDPFEFVSRGVG